MLRPTTHVFLFPEKDATFYVSSYIFFLNFNEAVKS